MTLDELLRLPGIPTMSKLEILQRADRTFSRVGRYYGGQIEPADVEALTIGVEMSPAARELLPDPSQTLAEGAEERRADDEYFRTGTRYPGQ